MLVRFLDISQAIKRALDDKSINKRALFPDDEELTKIEELLDALDIVREGTEGRVTFGRWLMVDIKFLLNGTW